MSELTLLQGDVLKGDVLKGDVLKGDVLKGGVVRGDVLKDTLKDIGKCQIIYNERPDMITQRHRRI